MKGYLIMIKLIKREGDWRHYSNGKDVVLVKLCLDASLYTNPGYYIGTGNGLAFSNPVHSMRFARGITAALAALKAGGCAYADDDKHYGEKRDYPKIDIYAAGIYQCKAFKRAGQLWV